jgi:hypothetical protein
MVRCRAASRNNLAQTCVAVVALAACAVLLRPGSAFAAAPVMKGADVHTPAHARAMPLGKVAPMAGGSRAAPWSSLGAVAMIWVVAASAVKAVQGRSPAARGGMKVVAVQVAPQSQPLAAPLAAPAAVPVLSSPPRAAPVSLDTVVPEVFSISDEVPVVAAEEKEHFAPTASTTRLPARFAGAQRLPRAKSTGSRNTSRAARRGVGAKLMPAREYHVIEPSFDSSRCRMRIQLGLRTTSRVHSERAHELKTPTANDAGSTAAKVLNITTFLVMHYAHQMEALPYH